MKELRPCPNCGLLVIHTGENRHPCSYCGHKAESAHCCIWCNGKLPPPLARLGSTSCLDCPPTARYPMRFTHP